MAVFISEDHVAEGNMFKYEERLKSPVNRIIDTTPTFVTYYHIDNDETTTDAGYQDVASIIGYRSPIRFQKIDRLPLYIQDQILVQLDNMDQGLDGSFESEATILPSTIIPTPNDHFLIPSLKGNYVFKVTDINYDNIMPDNYYKINFKLEYNDGEFIDKLNQQVLEDGNHICVLENIGTDQKCIINKKEYHDIKEVWDMYNKMAEFYKAMFYNDRHNSFLCRKDANYYYHDPLQAEFINKHHLFNSKNNFEVLILTEQYNDSMRSIKYAKSVYHFMELREMKLLKNFKYNERPGVTIHESSFYRWHDNTVLVLDPCSIEEVDGVEIFSDAFVESIKVNGFTDNDTKSFLQRFVRKEEIKVGEIPLTLADELLYINDDIEVFFITPLIMYAIKETIKKITDKKVNSMD